MNDKDTYIGKTAYQGSVAARYDQERVDEPIWKREQAWIHDWVQRIPPGARVLDVPTGTGRFIEALRGRGACVHAVDISEDMLAETRRHFPPDGESLVIRQADAEALPYPDGYFDYVVCWRLFHLLPAGPAGRVVHELARVCQGAIVLEVFGVEDAKGHRAVIRFVRSVLRALWRAFTWSRGSPSVPWAHITSYSHRERELLARFRECGLTIAESASLQYEQGPEARIFVLKREEAKS